MTEAEWLACEDPKQLVRVAARIERGANRKLRLFALELCRRTLNRIPRRELIGATDWAERAIDGENVEMPRALMFLACADDAGRPIDMKLAKSLYYASTNALTSNPLSNALGTQKQ